MSSFSLHMKAENIFNASLKIIISGETDILILKCVSLPLEFLANISSEMLVYNFLGDRSLDCKRNKSCFLTHSLAT